MSSITNLMTNMDFLQQVGMLMYMNDNDNKKLLKFTAGVNVAKTVMSELKEWGFSHKFISCPTKMFMK